MAHVDVVTALEWIIVAALFSVGWTCLFCLPFLLLFFVIREVILRRKPK